MTSSNALLLAALGLLLAACGGGQTAEPAERATPQVVNDVPAAATATATRYANFTAALVSGGAPDSQTPVKVDGLVPPTSETDAPMSLR
jgi:hypothetical protein